MRTFAFVLTAALAVSACHSDTTPGRTIEVSIEEGRLILSDSIRFETDSDALAEGSSEALDAIAEFLESHSGIVAMRVEGHADEHGTEDHNQDLSQRRARVVADYLIAHGVTQSIDAVGLGATVHLCEESTEACDARNRRVDFIVVED